MLRTLDARGIRRRFRPESAEATTLTASLRERVGLVELPKRERGVVIALPSVREQVRRQFIEARTGST